MKVLLVHVWFWPHIGGGNRHVELLGRELVSKGHEVTVWCADVPEHHEKAFKRFGMNVVRIPPSFVISGIDPMVSLSGLDPGEFDIVHLHDTLPILIRKVAKKASKMGVPIVTTYHNDYVKSSYSGKLLKWFRWHFQGKNTLDLSDARIVLRPYFEQLLRVKGVKGRIDVIPTGFEPPTEKERVPDGAPQGPFLLYLSRLTKQKGLDILLEAWSSMGDSAKSGHQLVIAGDGPLKSEVLKSIGRATTDLVYVGLVDEEEKSWLLRNASALILPSRFEGLPAILLEAAWEGLPVAMSDVNDLGKFTAEGGFGISMESDDVKSCIEAMSEMASADDRKIGAWSKAGPALAKDFLWPVVADQIELIYEHAVGRNSRS